MFFAYLAFVVLAIERRLERLKKRLEERCSHPRFRYVCDAWDFEYVCSFCEKRYFNETPKLKRSFLDDGKTYWLDGEGGVIDPDETGEAGEAV